MNEKIKIIVNHYPAHKLPEELRQGIDATDHVRITVEAEVPMPEKSLSSYVGSARGVYETPELAVGAVRDLRDTWQ